MNEILRITLIGLAAGVVGTGSGTIIALFVKNPGKAMLGFILGFAGGIMLAIVLNDLLPEAVDAGNFVTAFSGLLVGAVFILLLDLKMPHFHFFETTEELTRFIRTGTILGLGIAMHNLPEGIAIGASYVASPALGFTLALTIALHNIPEGIAMACPLCVGGMRVRWILLYTAMAGLPMGLGALIGSSLGAVSPLFLSLSLGFAAGAMLYIIFGELIPGAQDSGRGHAGTFGAVFGTIAGILLLSVI
ncbi:MAG TPA: ZIP family metal transporter [Firmicutes bacterium]|nr:ZIP family metal transporter [Bacillota bacterium]